MTSAPPVASVEANPLGSWANPALVAARPYKLGIPAGLEPGAAVPLFLFLHGYGAAARVFETALGLGGVAASRKFAYALPDGTPDSTGKKFWNASDACCDFDGKGIDDVAYLRAVLADAMARQNVDPKRVFVVGFSNGAFMAHRLACESSGQIAGIASIAGAPWNDAARCKPSVPVTVLQIHGDADPIVRYEGGHVLDQMKMQPHPPARETVAGWAKRDGCNATLRPGTSMDLEDKLDGPETVSARYEGCSQSAVELWTVRGGNHFVAQKSRAIEAIVAFLLAHPKS